MLKRAREAIWESWRETCALNKGKPGFDPNKLPAFHDRFLIVDDKDLYLIGASLKDLGKKCFAFTKLDAAAIARLKSRVQ